MKEIQNGWGMVRKFVRGVEYLRGGHLKKFAPMAPKLGGYKKYRQKRGRALKNFRLSKNILHPPHVLFDNSLKGSHWMYQLKISNTDP